MEHPATIAYQSSALQAQAIAQLYGKAPYRQAVAPSALEKITQGRYDCWVREAIGRTLLTGVVHPVRLYGDLRGAELTPGVKHVLDLRSYERGTTLHGTSVNYRVGGDVPRAYRGRGRGPFITVTADCPEAGLLTGLNAHSEDVLVEPRALECQLPTRISGLAARRLRVDRVGGLELEDCALGIVTYARSVIVAENCVTDSITAARATIIGGRVGTINGTAHLDGCFVSGAGGCEPYYELPCSEIGHAINGATVAVQLAARAGGACVAVHPVQTMPTFKVPVRGTCNRLLDVLVCTEGTYVQAGCFIGTVQDLWRAVKEKHEKRSAGRESYKHAIQFIKQRAKEVRRMPV